MKVSYVELDADGKSAVAKNMEIRQQNYVAAIINGNQFEQEHFVLIVGDRPGLSAPKDPSYHHIPLYSTKYCSGWLNAALHLEGIDETKLIWVNSADKDGVPSNLSIIERANPTAIVCLGGNAEKWVKKSGREYFKVNHPQYHKRFRNSERYELLDLLKLLMSESYQNRKEIL